MVERSHQRLVQTKYGVAENGCAFFILTMDKNAWLEASVMVDGEMAEAVSEVFARYVAGGVVIESTKIEADPEGEGKATGPLRVCGYLPVDGSIETEKQKLIEAVWHLSQIRPVPELTFKPVAELDWSEHWKQHFHPITIGNRLMITPTWLDISTTDRTVVRIEPGMAFGTGTHPTTQLCLEILDRQLSPQVNTAINIHEPQLSMIDVGCGSGILSIAAVKLGMSYGLGVDVDPHAVEAAKKNSLLNAVQNQLDFHVGSLEEIRAGAFRIQRAPIVVANILAPVIVQLLAAGLNEILDPQGKLILSGILKEQVPDVAAAVHDRGMKIKDQHQDGDWIALLVE